MRRGTTATISVPVDSTLVAAIDTTKIRLTVQQDGVTVKKENDEITIGSATFTVTLTPDETLQFDADNSAGKCKAFCKWVDETSSYIYQTPAVILEVLDTGDEDEL